MSTGKPSDLIGDPSDLIGERSILIGGRSILINTLAKPVIPSKAGIHSGSYRRLTCFACTRLPTAV